MGLPFQYVYKDFTYFRKIFLNYTFQYSFYSLALSVFIGDFYYIGGEFCLPFSLCKFLLICFIALLLNFISPFTFFFPIAYFSNIFKGITHYPNPFIFSYFPSNLVIISEMMFTFISKSIFLEFFSSFQMFFFSPISLFLSGSNSSGILL